MNKNETVKNNLNALILENNTTVKDLADFLGVSSSSVYSWIQGTRTPRYDVQERICKYYNVPSNYLLAEHYKPIMSYKIHLKDSTIDDLSTNCQIEPSIFTELQCVSDSYGNILFCKDDDVAETFTEFSNVFKGTYLNKENKQHLLSYAKFLLEQQRKGA